VHVKDARIGADGTPVWTVVGAGDIDYVGHFNALRAAGYAGVVSLETHYRAAGGTPESSSRECLAALRKLIDQA
ncbi:MAG: sugar phosphate isomerase/epimerase, partial [Armatimonadaceae bacterium]